MCFEIGKINKLQGLLFKSTIIGKENKSNNVHNSIVIIIDVFKAFRRRTLEQFFNSIMTRFFCLNGLRP